MLQAVNNRPEIIHEKKFTILKYGEHIYLLFQILPLSVKLACLTLKFISLEIKCVEHVYFLLVKSD